MVEDGKCVTSAALFPIVDINGGTRCILLNVAPKTASELLIAVPCDQHHEYLCEFPMHGMSIKASLQSFHPNYSMRHILFSFDLYVFFNTMLIVCYRYIFDIKKCRFINNVSVGTWKAIYFL